VLLYLPAGSLLITLRMSVSRGCIPVLMTISLFELFVELSSCLHEAMINYTRVNRKMYRYIFPINDKKMILESAVLNPR